MTDFSLINRLNTKDDTNSPLAEGIQYQQYELEVDGKQQTVNIPLREAVNFEACVVNNDTPLTRKSLKIILRQFRGVRS